MYYIVEQKNLNMLSGNIENASEVCVLVKNKKEKSFNAEDVLLMEEAWKAGAGLSFEAVNGKEELLFFLGTLAGSRPEEEFTLLGVEIAVPSFMKDRIHSVKQSARKARASRKKKAENAGSEKYAEKKDVPATPDHKESPAVEEAAADAEPAENPFVPFEVSMNPPVSSEASADVKNDPAETDSDDPVHQLMDILPITSEDVHYAWPTEMLMNNILTWAEKADSVEDLAMTMRAYHNGRDPQLYEACMDHLDEIMRIAKEDSAE